jgi:hypothetical protein
MMHFFEVRFIDGEYEMIVVASKCMDFRLYFTLTLPGGQSLDNYLHNVVHPQYKKFWDWAHSACINVESLEDAFAAMEVLATCMHKEMTYYYESVASCTARHKWGDVGGNISVSGIDIQRKVRNQKRWYDCASAFLSIHIMVILKIANEAVVEGMC